MTQPNSAAMIATKPYHRWPSNEDAAKPPAFDRCRACGCHRFSDDPARIAKAQGPCPQVRS